MGQCCSPIRRRRASHASAVKKFSRPSAIFLQRLWRPEKPVDRSHLLYPLHCSLAIRVVSPSLPERGNSRSLCAGNENHRNSICSRGWFETEITTGSQATDSVSIPIAQRLSYPRRSARPTAKGEQEFARSAHRHRSSMPTLRNSVFWQILLEGL